MHLPAYAIRVSTLAGVRLLPIRGYRSISAPLKDPQKLSPNKSGVFKEKIDVTLKKYKKHLSLLKHSKKIALSYTTGIVAIFVTRYQDRHFYLHLFRHILKSDNKNNGKCNGPGDGLQKMAGYHFIIKCRVTITDCLILKITAMVWSSIFRYRISLKN